MRFVLRPLLPTPPPPHELAGVGCSLEFSLTPAEQRA